jgi:peptide/nickel transport system permease protein
MLQQIDPVMLAFVLFLWMPYARLTHTMVLQIKGAEFLEAARALGAGTVRMLLRHLLPNAISPAIVLAARDIGLVVILQASLTFIGLIGGSEWGTLLSIGRRWIIGVGGNPFTYWWAFIPGTLVLILFGVGWNLLGDGLNNWLNPRSE